MTRLLLVIVLTAATSPAHAMAPADVVATVAGQTITRGDVERQLNAALKGRKVEPQALPVLQAQTLAELVDRRLVEAYLPRSGEGAGVAALAAAIERVKGDLKIQGSTLEAFLAKLGLSEAEWRRELAWQLNWEKYLARNAPDEALEAYFQSHAREFDGSEVRVSHILLRGTDAGAIAELKKQAEEICRTIEAGELTFAMAAEKFSTGPSKRNGGDLGFIPRHGRMDETFSAAAFALGKGQISPPVETPFGVHLIQVTDVKPGTKKWTDVREALQIAVARQLFEKIAAQERPNTKIEFTGAMPHFKRGTQELSDH